MIRMHKRKPLDGEPAPDAATAADAAANPAHAPQPADPQAPPAVPSPAPAEAKDAAAPSPAPAESKDAVALERELLATRDRYLRLLADFENARKRQAREREETIRRANEELLHALLPVLDHLELALAAPSLDRDLPFVKGIQLVHDQFVGVLHKFELRPIPAEGHPFDPEQHEALNQMPADDVPAGHVLHQLRRGWNLSGRLLRPAQVIVSSGTGGDVPTEPPR